MCLSACLSVCMFVVNLSFFTCICMCLSACLSVCTVEFKLSFFTCKCMCLSACLPVCLFVVNLLYLFIIPFFDELNCRLKSLVMLKAWCRASASAKMSNSLGTGNRLDRTPETKSRLGIGRVLSFGVSCL